MTGATDSRAADAVVRTTRHLADGREIIYYDRAPGVPRDAADHRELHDAPAATELRRDPLLEQWVVVAGHRQARTFLPPSDECPLCPTRDGRLTEIPEPDYQVVVFENRFPSLTYLPEAAADHDETTRHGLGRCDVVCFTADHGTSLSSVGPERIGLVLEAWIDRERSLSALPGIEYVFIFENRGVEIGVTLSHPHGQIYAYSFVPPRDERMRQAAARHRERTGGDLYDDVIADELADGRRVIMSGEHWVAFVPRAARWPYEVQLFTRRRRQHLAELDDAERAEFASMYSSLLRSLDSVLDVEMPYIAAWHQAPVHAQDDDSRLFLEVFSLRRAPGKLKFLAGSESAAGVWINDISPEGAAEALREGLRQVSA